MPWETVTARRPLDERQPGEVPQPLPSQAARERVLVALIARASAGDQAALESLYDETSPLVYSMALRVLRDPSSASDVVADVFTRLAQRAATYDPERGSPTAWLVMQTRTRAIDRYRLEAKTRSREVSLTAEMENEIPSPTEDSAAVSARGEVRRSIRAALALLTAPQRHVIEIAFYSGLSQREIAALLGEPLGTVKTRIRAAMRRLRELLGPSLEQLRP
jgi:RNA polymerase sigma-70 factor (ECF subfamily)